MMTEVQEIKARAEERRRLYSVSSPQDIYEFERDLDRTVVVLEEVHQASWEFYLAAWNLYQMLKEHPDGEELLKRCEEAFAECSKRFTDAWKAKP